jgi:hypothetical protein
VAGGWRWLQPDLNPRGVNRVFDPRRSRVIQGRTHRLSLDTDALGEAADWMDRQRALWGPPFDVIDEYQKEDMPQ